MRTTTGGLSPFFPSLSVVSDTASGLMSSKHALGWRRRTRCGSMGLRQGDINGFFADGGRHAKVLEHARNIYAEYLALEVTD